MALLTKTITDRARGASVSFVVDTTALKLVSVTIEQGQSRRRPRVVLETGDYEPTQSEDLSTRNISVTRVRKAGNRESFSFPYRIEF
jgi:hypothetical protein